MNLEKNEGLIKTAKSRIYKNIKQKHWAPCILGNQEAHKATTEKKTKGQQTIRKHKIKKQEIQVNFWKKNAYFKKITTKTLLQKNTRKYLKFWDISSNNAALTSATNQKLLKITYWQRLFYYCSPGITGIYTASYHPKKCKLYIKWKVKSAL